MTRETTDRQGESEEPAGSLAEWPPEEAPPGLAEEPDEHAWHLGIGATTARTWLADGESAEEDLS